MLNPYEELGVQANASDAQIKQHYLQKVKEYPPDNAPDQFQRIRSAYDLICNAEARLQHRLFHVQPTEKRDVLEHLLKHSEARRLDEAQVLELIR